MKLNRLELVVIISARIYLGLVRPGTCESIMYADNGDRQNEAGRRELHSVVQCLLVPLCVCKDHSMDVTFKLSIFEVFGCKFSHLT
jgi:hypothetical protein